MIIVETQILNIEIQNLAINDKYKTVFYCRSKKKPEGTMCIKWGWTTFEVGDSISMKGFFNDRGVFIVKSLIYSSAKEKNE